MKVSAAPVKDDILRVAQREGWMSEQTATNVWRFTKRDATLDVAFTFGGHLNVYHAHYRCGSEDWWLGNKDTLKRMRVLEILIGL